MQSPPRSGACKSPWHATCLLTDVSQIHKVLTMKTTSYLALLTSSLRQRKVAVSGRSQLLFSIEAGGAMAEVGLLPFVRVALQVSQAVLPRYRSRSVAPQRTATASELMPSACCSTVSPITWSTYFVCSCLCRCAQRRSKLCALGCSRSVHESVQQPVVSAFTWPAAGLSKISSKLPRFATPRSLSAPLDNTLSEGPGGAISKIVRGVKE